MIVSPRADVSGQEQLPAASRAALRRRVSTRGPRARPPPQGAWTSGTSRNFPKILLELVKNKPYNSGD